MIDLQSGVTYFHKRLCLFRQLKIDLNRFKKQHAKFVEELIAECNRRSELQRNMGLFQ